MNFKWVDLALRVSCMGCISTELPHIAYKETIFCLQYEFLFDAFSANDNKNGVGLRVSHSACGKVNRAFGPASLSLL